MMLVSLGLSAATARAEGDVVRIVVPWKAGGDTTLMSEQFAKPFGRALHADVTIENIDGGEGVKGTEAVAHAAADGKTLLAVHESVHGAFHAGRSDVNWVDFEPVCLVTTAPSVLGTRAEAPWHSLSELLEDARRRPGQITFGGSRGSSSHLLPSLVAHAAGVELRFVPIDGTAERYAALRAGTIDLAEMNVPGSKGLDNSGDVRVLAYAGTEHLADLPGVPTLLDLHLGVTYALYRGLFAPKGTPAAVLDRLEDACATAARDPELVAATHRLHAEVTYMGRKAYAQFLALLDRDIAHQLDTIGARKR